MSKGFYEYTRGIDALTVFRSLKNDPVMSSLSKLLRSLTGDAGDQGNDPSISLYSDILAALYPSTSDLSEYIRQLVLSDDNFYVEAAASGKGISDEVTRAVGMELSRLQYLADLSCEDIKDAIGCEEDLPSWTNHPVDLERDFKDKIDNLSRTGYGIFSKHDFFRIDGKEIVPVPYPDIQPLSELYGYERQRDIIIKNTEALIRGEGSSNMLLYGDAGTGKSSTIKAVAADFASSGLRLIEIKKEQLSQLADVIDVTSRQPLSFILFIDDLSFSGNDDNFSALKATLEGSISGHNSRTAIYATSNRRHIVRESFSDREGDELHVNDTLQETMSLAARFGLSVMFEKPDKDEYLDIVKKLAKQSGIDMPDDELLAGAESHAIRRGGRSPRTAKQYIDLIRSGITGRS